MIVTRRPRSAYAVLERLYALGVVRSCGLITLFAACSSSSSPPQPDAPVVVERSCTYGFTSVDIPDALTITKVASDGTRTYASSTNRDGTHTAVMIDAAVLTTIATGDFVEIAGADGVLFYAVRTGASFELHSFVAPSTDVKLTDLPAGLATVSIEANATDVFVRGAADTSRMTLWSIPRAGGTLAELASYTPTTTPEVMRAGERYVSWDERTNGVATAVIVTLGPPATLDSSADPAIHHTMWRGEVYGARLGSETSHSSLYQFYQLTPSYQVISTSMIANDDVAFSTKTLFGDGEYLFTSGASPTPSLAWNSGDCNFEPTLFHGDANRVLAVEGTKVLSVQTH